MAEENSQAAEKGFQAWLERKRAEYGVLYRCVLFMCQLQVLAFFAAMIAVTQNIVSLMVYYIINTIGWAIMMIVYWIDKCTNEYIETGRRSRY